MGRGENVSVNFKIGLDTDLAAKYGGVGLIIMRIKKDDSAKWNYKTQT